MTYRFFLGMVLWGNCVYAAVEVPIVEEVTKKNIIIFTSSGGGGHTSAAGALVTYLKDSYNVEVVNIMTEVFSSIDPIKKITFNAYTGESFYNYCLQNSWIRIANMLAVFGDWYVNTMDNSLEKLLYDYLLPKNIDLIISVIPFIDVPAIAVAKKMNIPFLLIPTDLNTYTYVRQPEVAAYTKFVYGLSCDDHALTENILGLQLPEQKIKILGFPLRPDFFESKDVTELKKEFALPEDKRIILLMMGAAGSQTSFKYLRRLTKLDVPCHIIVCLGRNEKLRIQIEELNFPQNITLSLLGFTQRISDLMAVSDLIITKPGGLTTCEALQMNVPMLLDATTSLLTWERLTVDFMVNSHFGDVINRRSDIVPLVRKYLTEGEYIKNIHQNMEQYPKRNFAREVTELIAQMLDN